jgi:hypothetical protein
MDTTVYLKQWSVAERIAQASILKDETKADDRVGSMVLAIIQCLCDEAGNRIFTDADKDTILNTFPMSFLDRVFLEALEHNGMKTKSVEQAQSDFTSPQN